jgi:hypothetical protein
MAKTKVSEFDAVASNNTDINSVNVAEGCPPSGINNAIREMASLLKKQEVGTDAMTSPDIDGGTIDGATIGGSSGVTIGVSDGTNSAPSIKFTGDTNTGIYRGGTDILKFVTAGTDAITIDASQNTTFAGTVTASGLTVEKADNTSSLVSARYNSSNRKIGFNVNNSNGQGFLAFNSNSVSASANQTYDVNGYAGKIDFTDAMLFDIAGNGTAGNTISFSTAMKINNNGDISFYEDTGTTPKLFWDASNEALGIGTSSVNGTLHVQANPTAELSLWGGGGSYGRSKFNIQSVDDGTSTGKFQITTESTVSSSPELLTITNAGNVGIGTSSPNRMLTLENGDIQIHDSGTGDPLLNFSVGGTQASPTQSWSFRIDNSESDKFQLMDVTDSRIVLTADGDGNVGINTSSPTSYANSQATLFIEDSINPAIALSDTGQSKDYFISALGTQLSIRYADGGGSSNATNITELIKMDNSGAVTMPNQPAFQAYGTADSTISTLAFFQNIIFNTEIFDQNSDFNTSNYTFTAPVTGKYQLNAIVRLADLQNDSSFYIIQIKTSNKDYKILLDTNVYSADLDYHSFTVSVLADMDANDTAVVQAYQNTGTIGTTIVGSFNYTVFSGYLVA